MRLDADGPRTLRTGTGGTRVLVARGLCLFVHVDASAVPMKQRAGFVALQVRRAAPFPDAEHDLAWFGDQAAVWYWSRDRIAGLLGTRPARARFRAEACYRGSPPEDDDAVELLDLRLPSSGGEAAGFEARRWRHGRLLGSRWWPDLPSPAQWQTFLRGNGLAPTLPRPAPTDADLRMQPLGGLQSGAWAGQAQAYWPLLATCAGAVVLAMFSYQLAAIARAHRDILATQQRVTALERHLDTVITARTRADDALSNVDAMLALRPPASQTRLMGEIARITPGAGWQVMLWQQATPEALEVTLRGSVPDATDVVGAWEQSALLADVTPATGARSDELTIRARLVSAPSRGSTP